MKFRQPDLTSSDMWLPCNRQYQPLGEHVYGRTTYDRCTDRAWHFRCDPHEIEGAWAERDGLYLYTSKDRGEFRSECAFIAAYVERLRLVLAEAVPGVGGLSLEPE